MILYIVNGYGKERKEGRKELKAYEHSQISEEPEQEKWACSIRYKDLF